MVRSCDDLLTASDLVSGGRFGGRPSVAAAALEVPLVAPRSVSRRPSIFRRCYSSESNAIVPSWFSVTQQQPQQQQQQPGTGQSELASTSAVVLINPSQQPADADALVDCLPPYYWEAKHMPRLVKVSAKWTLFAGPVRLMTMFFMDHRRRNASCSIRPSTSRRLN